MSSEAKMPTNLNIHGRRYRILVFPQEDEKRLIGNMMVKWSKENEASLGEEEGQYLLKYQGDIDPELRGRVIFVFTDWWHSSGSWNVAYIYWHEDRWVQDWDWLGCVLHGRSRLLRRIK